MPYSSGSVKDESATTAKRNSSRQRRKPTIWTREKIYKLIELYRESDCLWNHYSELYKNKDCRTKAIERICTSLGITKNDYGKKVHNLRNQFNSELKKYERRLKDTDNGIAALSPKACRWEHFETLMFLRPIIEPRPGYQPQCKNLLKSEECANTELQATSTRSQLGGDIIQLELLSVEDVSNITAKEQSTCDLQMAPRSEDLPNIAANLSMTTSRRESPTLSAIDKQNNVNPAGVMRDQWDAFGELIANEFRNLNSPISRKKLKRRIMQIMLEVGEEDDEKYTSTN